MMTVRPLVWIGSAKRDLLKLPEEVIDTFGYALDLAQHGEMYRDAKALAGVGDGVVEVVEDFDGDTYRAVYTAKLRAAVYVLHCFKKKSKRGIATPKPDLHLIAERLKQARARDKEIERDRA